MAVLRVATLLVLVLAATGPAAAHAGHESGTPSTPLEPPDDDGWPPLAVGAGVLGLLVAAGWLGRASGILTRRQAGVLLAGSLVVVLCVFVLVAG